MGKIFCIGDLHGAHRALLQCLERSGFNNETDTLISLGDIVDGWSQSFECVEELLKIKNLVAIRGNHDQWFNEFISKDYRNPEWMTQGGESTLRSYMRQKGWGWDMIYQFKPKHIPESHRQFFFQQELYHIDEDHRLFVHGGYNRHAPIEETYFNVFYWDRDMWSSALSFQSMVKGGASGKVNKWKNKDDFKNIFIGHTATTNWDIDKPMLGGGGVVYNLDTGSGWAGYLTIMDVDTKRFWQSDKVAELYPDETGRR